MKFSNGCPKWDDVAENLIIKKTFESHFQKQEKMVWLIQFSFYGLWMDGFETLLSMDYYEGK